MPMPIRLMTSTDQAAYATFRRELWPFHPGGGYWENVELKYYLNPHGSLCPGSGLYAYFSGDRLLGIMGAYPMPVTFAGTVHPGHMLVDWAVLSKFRFGPIAGELWNELIKLPGHKYASSGSRFSQGPLQKRGRKIQAVESTGLIRPSFGIAAKFLDLANYDHPAPLHLDRLETSPEVELIDGSQLRAAVPKIEKAAWVHRGPEFWGPYCNARIYNGAVPLRIHSGAGEADLLLLITQTGESFRFGTLMSAQLVPYTAQCAKATGRLLGTFLRRLNVCVLFATEADVELSVLVRSASWYVRRTPSHWWSIPQPSDSFRHDQVSWWLTKADRDSHYGGLQPFTTA